MRPLVRTALLFLLASSIAGCASMDYRDRVALPSQDIGSEVPRGKTRVIVFNATRPSWVTAGPAAPVMFELDGKFAATIRGSHYLQLFLEPGVHLARLEHIDTFAFTDSYRLDVGHRPLFARITRQLGSNRLDIVDELPVGFAGSYKAVTP